MSDLQLALLALGALIILLVVAYNWWQERKLHQQTEKHFNSPKHDVLLDREEGVSVRLSGTQPAHVRQEPSSVGGAVDAIEDTRDFEISSDIDTGTPLPTVQFEHDYAEIDQAILSDSEQLQPEEYVSVSYAHESSAVALEKLHRESSRLPEELHPQIDLTALLYLPQNIPSAACFSFMDALKGLNKPSAVYGLNSSQHWERIIREHDTEYSKLACSLQLADRSGCISRSELNLFQKEVDMLGAKLAAQIEWQGNGDPYINAVNLDQFCIEVDKTIGIHIKHGDSGPFTGTKLRGLVEARGMTLKEDGAFHFEDEDQNLLFVLVNQENHPFSPKMLTTSVLRNITFQLDIPRVKNITEVFDKMVFVARQLEHALGGRLVDDLQKELGEMQLEKIRHQLKIIHATMIARNIVPGSPSALRLFS